MAVSARDDDDINDVALMAGVNISEENARIQATSAQLVGTQIRSCKDELFLASSPLLNRIHHIGIATANRLSQSSLIFFGSYLDVALPRYSIQEPSLLPQASSSTCPHPPPV